MNNMLGKYIPLDSFVHRLDPRVKLVSLMFLLVSVFFDAGFIGYLIMGAFVALLASSSKIKLSQIIKSIKPMIFMMLLIVLVF